MEKMNEWDPSLPRFRFTQAEREAMIERGMSEKAINQKELEATTKLVEDKVNEERKAA